MSHNLKFKKDGSAVYASTQAEWHHGITNHAVADRPMTVAEVLEMTGMGDYTLTEQPMFTEHGTVSSHKAIYLNGDGDPELVGVVGKDRLTTQPIEMLSPMDVIADAAGGSVVSAGMFGKGAVWFAVVVFPDEWVLRGEKYKGYLFGRDSADGSTPLDIRPTFIKPVCENTYNMALSASRGVPRYTMRHTSHAKVSVAAARQAIGMVPAYAEEFESALKALYEQDFTFQEFRALTDSLFGTPDPKAKTSRSQTIYDRRFAELTRLWKADTQAQSYRRGGSTKQTAFDAIGEYLDWTYGSDSGRIERQVMGDTARIKTQALVALR